MGNEESSPLSISATSDSDSEISHLSLSPRSSQIGNSRGIHCGYEFSPLLTSIAYNDKHSFDQLLSQIDTKNQCIELLNYSADSNEHCINAIRQCCIYQNAKFLEQILDTYDRFGVAPPILPQTSNIFNEAPALFLACRYGGDINCIELLLKYGASFHTPFVVNLWKQIPIRIDICGIMSLPFGNKADTLLYPIHILLWSRENNLKSRYNVIKTAVQSGALDINEPLEFTRVTEQYYSHLLFWCLSDEIVNTHFSLAYQLKDYFNICKYCEKMEEIYDIQPPKPDYSMIAADESESMDGPTIDDDDIDFRREKFRKILYPNFKDYFWKYVLPKRSHDRIDDPQFNDLMARLIDALLHCWYRYYQLDFCTFTSRERFDSKYDFDDTGFCVDFDSVSDTVSDRFQILRKHTVELRRVCWKWGVQLTVFAKYRNENTNYALLYESEIDTYLQLRNDCCECIADTVSSSPLSLSMPQKCIDLCGDMLYYNRDQLGTSVQLLDKLTIHTTKVSI